MNSYLEYGRGVYISKGVRNEAENWLLEIGVIPPITSPRCLHQEY